MGEGLSEVNEYHIHSMLQHSTCSTQHASTSQKQNFGTGKGLNALIFLSKMAETLDKHSEAAQWTQLLHTLAPHFSSLWGECGDRLGCNEGVNSFSSAMAPAPYFKASFTA
mgnify:CR=1 FL=1